MYGVWSNVKDSRGHVGCLVSGVMCMVLGVMCRVFGVMCKARMSNSIPRRPQPCRV